MVVDQRRQQVVRSADGMKISGEVQVDVFHRNDLRVTAAGGAALHAETGAETGFAQAYDRLLADAAETVVQTHRGRGLALAGRRRRDRCHQDQLAIRLVLQAGDIIRRDFRLGLAVGHQRLFRNTNLFCDIVYRLWRRGARYLYVTHLSFPPILAYQSVTVLISESS